MPLGIDIDRHDRRQEQLPGDLLARDWRRHLEKARRRTARVYAEPIWIGNTNSFDLVAGDDNDTFIVGLGGRSASGRSCTSWPKPRRGSATTRGSHASFAIEMRAGGHSFQINFSDGFGTTMAQMARGGFDSDDWYLGFNISRKFF